MEIKDVKQYYNEFLKSRMLTYGLSDGNERINSASDFILKNIGTKDNILEVGCGIGIITERIAYKLHQGFIWACDISDQNIWYAKQTIKNKNIDFFAADVLKQFTFVKERINSKVDTFIFIDVIEHLPKEKHIELFANLNSIAAKDARIILTFPSEYYQNYLIKNNPEELQIIDEIISIDHITNLIRETGFEIYLYELKDIWMERQYVNCLLAKKQGIKSLNNKLSVKNRVIRKIKYFYNKRKYIDKVFNNKPEEGN